jgi:hypothetical protein
MNCPLPPTETPLALLHIWSGLPSDLQQRTVRLLAQLAFARLCRHEQSPIQEIHDGNSARQSQGPS